MMGDLFQPWHLIILLITGGLFALLYVLPLWLIAKKAGLHKWMAVAAIVPPVGVIVLYYIALSKWHPRPA
jgi:hypothetical protein